MKTKKSFFGFFITLIIFGFNCSLYSQWISAGSVSSVGSYPSISVPSPNVVWISGGVTTPIIYRTVNGGTTWTSVPVTGLPAKALMCIWAIDSLTAYVGDGGDAGGSTGGDATVSKTTNGGLTWTAIFNTGGVAGFFNGIFFSKSNPSFGFAESDPPSGVGQPYYLQKTTNGGVNWEVTYPPGVSGNASAQNSLFAIDAQFYGFGLNASAVAYLTSNGGTNWFSGLLLIPGTFVSGLSFNDNKMNGIASTNTSYPTIARTTNGGFSWTPISLGGSGTTTLSFVKFVNGTNNVYFLGTSTSVAIFYRSTNSGANWTAMTVPAGAVNFAFFDFVRVGMTVTGYAVSSTGTVIKLTELATLVKSDNKIIPSEFSLQQNYPNPFNPTTTIQFKVKSEQLVKLIVFDMVGREIETLVNEKLGAGTYSVNWNATNYPSGVYFYKMETDGYSETKRMVVVK